MIVNNRYIKNLFLVCFFTLSSIAFPQDIAFKNSNFKKDKQGLKLAKASISIADEIYERMVLRMNT